MELKTVEEYSKEMTREEFDKFTEEWELCPSAFGLKEDCNTDENGITDCKWCYNQVLVGIEFLKPLPALPKETLPILKQLQELEVQAAKIDETKKKLREDLLNAMEKYGVTKWDNEVMTVTYTAPTTRNSIDSDKLKKEMPEVAKKYSKTSNVKSSIKIKLKGEK